MVGQAVRRGCKLCAVDVKWKNEQMCRASKWVVLRDGLNHGVGPWLGASHFMGRWEGRKASEYPK
jgi:hypothetical protein